MEATKIFNEYAKNYDLKNPHIMGKYHHSYRVMEYGLEIAKSINLGEKDTKLVYLACLFHDIARFMQWTNYETYIDDKSIDHGDMGYQILSDGLIDELVTEEEKKIILTSVKNHNKFEIEEGLTEKELLISKIVRDADKMDIMLEQGIIKEEGKLKKEILDSLYKHNMIANNLVENDIDGVLRLIAFIFDFNFKYTYKFILDKNIVENVINRIEIYTNEDLSDLQNNLITYLKERLTC